jgi:protein-tyrosine-phosphatase
MTDTRHNVLFICTGHSARSIIAEGLLDQPGSSRFKAFSAGNYPKGAVHPLALEAPQSSLVSVRAVVEQCGATKQSLVNVRNQS